MNEYLDFAKDGGAIEKAMTCLNDYFIKSSKACCISEMISIAFALGSVASRIGLPITR
jgi:hypothetical protein